MDLSTLLQLLLRVQDYGDSGNTGDDRFFNGQNRRLVTPELRAGEKDYNKTIGNPPVTLEDGWLRSLLPWETGEGPPGGMYNDDGKTRTLEELMWMRNPGLMRGYQHEAKKNKEPPPHPTIGRYMIKQLENQYRYKGNL